MFARAGFVAHFACCKDLQCHGARLGCLAQGRLGQKELWKTWTASPRRLLAALGESLCCPKLPVRHAIVALMPSECCKIPLRSYDSSKEDSQNPFPSAGDTPTGKTAFQKGKAGKKQIQSPPTSTDTLDCNTPQPAMRRANSSSDTITSKVDRALRRSQTVDEMTTTTTTRKKDARARQKN